MHYPISYTASLSIQIRPWYFFIGDFSYIHFYFDLVIGWASTSSKCGSQINLAWEYISVLKWQRLYAVDGLVGGGRINLMAWQICLKRNLMEHNICYIINVNQSWSFYVLGVVLFSVSTTINALCWRKETMQYWRNSFFLKIFYIPAEVHYWRNS